MTKPFLWPHRKPTVQKTLRAVVCHACGGYFTPSGLRMHTGSKKCEVNTKARPLKRKASEAYTRMREKGKRVVVTNVALAITRRGLEDLCGLEIEGTRLLQTDLECSILEQYWIHEWAFLVWEKYNKIGYTRSAYHLFEKINAMSEEDRESEIGLIMLSMYG